MNAYRRVIALMFGLMLLGWGACAPVDPLPSEETRTKPPVLNEQVAGKQTVAPAGHKERVKLAIDQVHQRDLLSTNGFWTIFHGILGLGPSVTLLNPETKERFNALDYICKGGKLRSLQFVPTTDGVDVQTGELFVGQGHQDQFIAEMAQWGLPADRKFLVHGSECTFKDFVQHAKMRARVTANQELSWAILVLAQYYGTDMAWTNSYDENIDFNGVVRYELNADIENAACGGTHRLFGLTWALQLHQRNGGKKEGVWKEVRDKLDRHHELARKYQNPDGSFSTSFFRGAGHVADKQLRMNTTGHMLEWLALSLSDEELRQPWVQNAANALCLMIFEIQGQPMEGGTLYHAVHGLLIYYTRLFGGSDLGPLESLIPAIAKRLPDLIK